MKVILLEDIPKLGKKYDVKNFKDGFARNFLLPKKLAEIATKEAVRDNEIKKRRVEEIKEMKRRLFISALTSLNEKEILLKRRAGDKGQLFDKVDKKDIQAILEKEIKVEIPEESISNSLPLAKTGRHQVEISWEKKKVKFILNIEPE